MSGAIVAIEKGDEGRLVRVESLLVQMYEYMEERGLQLTLVDDGASRWRRSIEPTLGKFGCLLGFEEEGRLGAFVHGALKLAPSYLGGVKVGMIGHVFVHDDFRRRGLGGALVERAEAWLGDHGATQMELQVLWRNEAGRAFWDELGYTPDLLQMRKPL